MWANENVLARRRKCVEPGKGTDTSDWREQVQLKVPERAKVLSVELHKSIGEGKTRVIGKGTVNMAGNLLPRMSGGREAEETITMKGNLKGGAPAKQDLSVLLKMVELREDQLLEDLEVNRERIRRAMKRQERKARHRARMDAVARKYEPTFKGKERPFNVDAVRVYNLPEAYSSKSEPRGVQFRVRTPALREPEKTAGHHQGFVSRIVEGSRHPAFAQSISIPAAGEVDFVLEDRAHNQKLGQAPFPVKELAVGKSYLTDILMDEKGTHILAVVNSVIPGHLHRAYQDVDLIAFLHEADAELPGNVRPATGGHYPRAFADRRSSIAGPPSGAPLSAVWCVRRHRC
jgi:hypothetical protein